jgi:hypothetical protein
MNPQRKPAVHLPAFPRTRHHRPAAPGPAAVPTEAALRPLQGLLLLVLTFQASTLLLVVTLLVEPHPRPGLCGFRQPAALASPEVIP